MVKYLKDLCLDTISHQFDIYCKFSNNRLDLPPIIAEQLLHRLIDHDYLHSHYLPAITYNLLPSRLTRLDIYKSELLNDTFLTQIGRVCTRLRRIRLLYCPSISDDGLSELLINQTRLEHLELRWLPTIEGRCLTRFSTMPDSGENDFETSDGLQFLCLKGCADISPEYVYHCSQRNRSIRNLNLCGVRNMNGEWLRKIAFVLSEGLLELNLSECLNVTDDGLFGLAESCVELRRISLMECMKVTEAGLRALLRFCSKMESVDLAFCRRWDTGLSYDLLRDIPASVTCLCLSGIQADFTVEQFVSALVGLPKLSQLILSGFSLLSDVCLEKILSSIGCQLTTLDLSGSFGRISDVGLESVSNYCTHLRYLGLGLLANLNGQKLLPLFSNPKLAGQLETLLFANVSFDQVVLMAIAESCKNLQTLDVSGVRQADDNFMLALAEMSCQKLQRLFIKGQSKITDQGICAIASRAKELRSLCISGNVSLTDRSIFTLANHCDNIQELYLNGCTMISRSSLQYLKDRSSGRVAVYHFVPTSQSAQDTVIAKNLDTGEFVRL